MHIQNNVSAAPFAPPAKQQDVEKPAGSEPATEEVLSPDEKQEVAQLKQRDREVRAHEQAHLSAAGQYASGGASFTYQRGADGTNYAVGGEVGIDASAVAGKPEETIRKMDIIRRAALAPASPSGQDRKVATQASSAQIEARQELQQQQQTENKSQDTQDVAETSNNNPFSEKAETGTLLDLTA